MQPLPVVRGCWSLKWASISWIFLVNSWWSILSDGIIFCHGTLNPRSRLARLLSKDANIICNVDASADWPVSSLRAFKISGWCLAFANTNYCIYIIILIHLFVIFHFHYSSPVCPFPAFVILPFNQPSEGMWSWAVFMLHCILVYWGCWLWNCILCSMTGFSL